jgi:hypothetical protein
MAKVYDMTDWSHKAMMHQHDADHFEAIVLAQAARAEPRLEVLEWGSGRSTLYFSRRLRELGIRYHWTSLEYDRGYFEQSLEPGLPALGAARVRLCDRGAVIDYPAASSAEPELELIVFDRGPLSPFLEQGASDRGVDLEDYIGYPATLAKQFDLVLVDGRKRRRCLLEAARLMKADGVTVLHDAHREYYHCAMTEFRQQSFAGEILWLGTQSGTRLPELLALATQRVGT